jgi:hypothetical protein
VDERERLIQLGLIPRSEVSYGSPSEEEEEEEKEGEEKNAVSPEQQRQHPSSENAIEQQTKSIEYHITLLFSHPLILSHQIHTFI